MKKTKTPKQLLKELNDAYLPLHKAYEEMFWVSYMGDHSVDKRKDQALDKRNAFASNAVLREEVAAAILEANKAESERLSRWLKYFDCYQSPKKLQQLREKINALETKMAKARASQKQGYFDPKTKKFIEASELKMIGILRTHPEEALRKACHEAIEKLSYINLKDYVKFVGLLNQYARGLGYEDFYAYKLHISEGMSKKELFKIFDDIYKRTKYAFKDIRKLEKEKPGLRKPWNKGFMMAGDLTKEEDQYFPFNKALERWGKSFQALGINFKDGTLTLDLLDRKGKHNNGFCHWPEPVHFKDENRVPGKSNFTCTTVYGQPGSAVIGYDVLFHEGGHAAHYLSSEEKDICMNIEYPPASVAWAETQSMFLDTVFFSYEWRTRYAKNDKGETYPWKLYMKRLKRLSVSAPLGLMSILSISNFERIIYETNNLTPKKVVKISRDISEKYEDLSQPTIWTLRVSHIYSWESSCYYHGYGLAELALQQWRDYFYKKYKFIVDNPAIGKEMQKVWELASSKTFKEFVMIATGKPLSADPWVENVTRSEDSTLKIVKARAERLKKQPESKGKINLNAKIHMVSGKKIIADNSKSFEDMAKKYSLWLATQKIK